ncbi:hypothetical protein ACFQZ4_19610 [Catellatospora coxensis]|uniref:Uncharacterized protein n=1 Tax=Catellatospora coxensis TaxID=310354 RepID=A0A8J3KW03_9ACTN|nr:hypothetical protein [Catellatospora coxensis]GIG04434.1 hypothetical protein Cco03nite_11340 [Catellatospora coxensis]
MSAQIPPHVTLPRLVKLIDTHAAELLNPTELYPQLVDKVGKRRARWMWTAALAIVTVRDDLVRDDVSATEVFASLFGLICLLLVLTVDGWWDGALCGAAVALFAVSLAKTLFRHIRDEWWS